MSNPLQVGDKVRITPRAWSLFVQNNGVRPGEKFNPGEQSVQEIHADGIHYMLTYPHAWWRREDLILAAAEKEMPRLDPRSFEALTRAFCSVMEMWGRRYDYGTDALDQMTPTEGEPFYGPVVVDLGQLSIAHTSLMAVIQQANPQLHDELFAGGGAPDAPLPLPDPVVTNLDDVRIRADREFEDEQIAYVEALWGKKTYAFNAAIRDLEAMRRGRDDGTLRKPETYHEGMLLVHHVRALANDLARNFGMDHLVREDDDLGKGGEG